jgi:hypothetical protein
MDCLVEVAEMIRAIMAVGVVLAFGAGCDGVSSPAGPPSPPGEPAQAGGPEKTFERVPQPPPSNVAVGEVPQRVMAAARSALATHSPAAARAQLVRAEATVFGDGSLGCPEPGMFYTMATVPGYYVTFEIDGELFDYRISESGQIKRCLPRQPIGQPSTQVPTQ